MTMEILKMTFNKVRTKQIMIHPHVGCFFPEAKVK